MRPALLAATLCAALSVPCLAQAQAPAPAPAPTGGPAPEEPPPAVPGQTPDEQAQRLADEAVEAYRTAKYDDAVRLFKQAYGLRADPAILYNLAKCFDKTGRREEALEYYRRYLVAEGTDPKLRQKAEEKVAALSAALRPSAAPPAAAPPVKAERPGRLFFYSGVGLAAAGVAGLVVGVALYGAAAKDYSTFGASSDELDKRAARDHAQSLGKGSIAGYIVGAALLGGGGALVGLAVKKGFFRRDRVAISPSGDGATLLWAGSF